VLRQTQGYALFILAVWAVGRWGPNGELSLTMSWGCSQSCSHPGRGTFEANRALKVNGVGG